MKMAGFSARQQHHQPHRYEILFTPLGKPKLENVLILQQHVWLLVNGCKKWRAPVHLPFIALLSVTFIIIILSIYLFFRAGQFAEKINIKVVENNISKKRILRFCAVSILIFCCIVSAIYLPQTKYGSYLRGKQHFELFLKNRSIEEAEEAFSLWQRSANKEAFSWALPRMPQDSRAWQGFIMKSAGLYYLEGQLDNYVQYLLGIEKELTHPISKSALYFELGNVYLKTDPKKAENYFNMVLSLQGDKGDMARARGNINEMHNLNVGQKAPDFVMTTIDNKKITLQELQGKIVLLEFWSIRCGACIEEIPTLQSIYNVGKSKELVIVSISLEYGEEIVQFIQKKNLPGQHVMVDRETSTEILETFNIQFVPTNYILNKEGEIAHKDLQGKQLEEAIIKLLN